VNGSRRDVRRFHDGKGTEMQHLRARMALAILLVASAAFGADKTWTWTGVISDNHCGTVHNPGHMGDDVDASTITGRECMIGKADGSVPGCISAKNGGKFVFVTGGRVFQIGNQDFPDLRVHADHTVQLTGVMIKDTVTVSKIVMAADHAAARR
jgi:hypothetical protein